MAVQPAAPSSAPAPIDARGPRFNQAVLAVALVAGFLLQDVGGWVVIPIWAVVLFLGAAFGPRVGPFLRLYADVVKPRLGPPKELEDPRPPRFAAAIGTTFLTAGTIALVAGLGALAWGLALVVAALAGLAAATGLCVGCEVYVLIARARGIALSA
jgi:hypothetical protein